MSGPDVVEARADGRGDDDRPQLALLLTSPRVPAGLLSREAWLTLERADLVLGGDDEPQVEALEAAGLVVEPLEQAADGVPAMARALVELAGRSRVVWVGSSDGDPGLTDALAAEVSRLPHPPTIEVVVGSYDVPGARLLDLVAVMDRLRSPGGCPWDAEQTHLSLVPYLIEEAYEAVEAIESGARDDIVEELGDVLLQVAFHARVGEDHPTDPFDIDDVAAAIVAKLVRRHPHVFADVDAADSAAVEANWETIKADEKAAKVGPASSASPTARGAAGVLDGIPAAMPTLAKAAKVVSRLRRRGLLDTVPALLAAAPGSTDVDVAGARLLALVTELDAAGIDSDQALRTALHALTRYAFPLDANPGGAPEASFPDSAGR